MSGNESTEPEIFLYVNDDKWNSRDSIKAQKIAKISKSETHFMSRNVDSSVTFKELELHVTKLKNSKEFQSNWEFVTSKSRFSKIIRTRSLLRDELEMLKINLSIHDKVIALRESQINKNSQYAVRKIRLKKFIKKWRQCIWSCRTKKNRDLMAEIEGSESAKTDTVIWKFLKRGSSVRKELNNGKKYLIQVHDWLALDLYIQNSQPLKITCPNCTFFITTNVKKVSTLKTTLISMIFAILGFCIASQIFYFFKDTVHLCPLCKIYLGFCPAIGIQSIRRESQELTPINSDIEIKKKSSKMVSASSTSAKNLFAESKLRLSDRVQVNVNNVAAIARQIQRGSKSNENLIAAAKNFALQEAAIDNSETNLKKLKLLSTHINNQIDSIHNNSLNVESVLEQVRSMQR